MAALSLLRFIAFMITLRLRFPEDYCNRHVAMKDGMKFTIFRHMRLRRKKHSSVGSIFIVRFKFKKFSHKTNIRTSRIPMPLIAGFPGFRDKLWMIDWQTGYWQGLYQWDSTDAIEKYKKSFVLGIMNRRSIHSTLSYEIIPDLDINEYLRRVIVG